MTITDAYRAALRKLDDAAHEAARHAPTEGLRGWHKNNAAMVDRLVDAAAPVMEAV